MTLLTRLDPTALAPGSADPDGSYGLIEDTFSVIGAVPSAPFALMDDDARRAMGERFDVTERQTRLVETVVSEWVATEEGYDAVIDDVFAATGVRLGNPMRGGYRDWIEARTPPGEALPSDTLQQEMQIFREQLEELRRQRPELRQLAADGDARGQDLARRADADLEALDQRRDGNAFLNLLGRLGGGVVGSRRDPLFWASFAFGAPGAAGRTALARVGAAAATQGAVNAAVSAAAQPAVQDWRAQLGLRAGADVAIENVGFAFLLGAAPGGAVQGAVELGPALRRMFDGQATAADVARLDAALPEPITAELKAGLDGAAAADALDAALIDRVGASDAVATRVSLSETVAALEDPAAPLPVRPAPLGDNGPAMRALMDARVAGARDPYDAAAVLAENAELIASALASDAAGLRLLGRLASLKPEAAALAREGGVAPAAAALAADATDDPAAQAAMIGALIDRRPGSAATAREAIADEAYVRGVVQATILRMSQPAIDAAAANGPRPQRLLQVLARRGLRDAPALRIMLGGNPFVPGRGRLLRTQGFDKPVDRRPMTLDEALRLAKDEMFIFDADERAGMTPSATISDLLDLIDADARDRAVYLLDAGDMTRPQDIIARVEQEAAAVTADWEAAGLDVGVLREDIDAAAQLVLRGKVGTFDEALERAAIMQADDIDEFRADVRASGDDWPGEWGDEGQGDAGLAERAGGPGDAAGGDDAAQGGGADAPRDQVPLPGGATEPIDARIPFVDRDGNAVVLSRAEAEALAEADELLGDLVASCRPE
jgi:hypothetical protein